MKATLEASSEYLRLALPLMARFKVPITPPNYAVWYSYVAGTNPALRETMDGLLDSDTAIDEALTETLYRSHLDAADSALLEASTRRVDGLVADLHRLIRDADSEVETFARSLEASGGALGETLTAEQLKALTERLMDSTRHMNEGNTGLRRQLDDSRRETETLRSELARARQESRRDTLTGLANRAGLEEAHDALAEQAGGSMHCLVMADIDRFKQVNDRYGHLFGDKVIRTLAKVIKDSTKGRDLAARFGGEEFVVMLPATPLAGGVAVAEEIRRTIERGRILNTRTGEQISHVTLSLGVTAFTTGEPLYDVVARADGALYQAKHNGRNRVEVAADGELAAAS